MQFRDGNFSLGSLLISKRIRNDSQNLFFGSPFEISIRFWQKYYKFITYHKKIFFENFKDY
jgi:hypothetical protein